MLFLVNFVILNKAIDEKIYEQIQKIGRGEKEGVEREIAESIRGKKEIRPKKIKPEVKPAEFYSIRSYF